MWLFTTLTSNLPVAVYAHNPTDSLLFLPLLTAPGRRQKPIVLQWITKDHVAYVKLKFIGHVRWPPLNPQHKPITRLYNLDSGWEDTLGI